MEQTSRLKEVIHTELPERHTGIRNETERSSETSLLVPDNRKKLYSSKLQASTLGTEKEETESSILCPGEFPRDGDARKNQRAKANALMDIECLPFLKLFNEHKSFYVDELSQYLKQPRDWLKVSLLIRADFLETLDSTVRVTPEGQAAWEYLNQFRRLHVERE